MESKDTAQKQGSSDASQNKGQKNPNDFKNDADRKAYQSGYNNEKKK